jgi:hypothetical protein
VYCLKNYLDFWPISQWGNSQFREAIYHLKGLNFVYKIAYLKIIEFIFYKEKNEIFKICNNPCLSWEKAAFSPNYFTIQKIIIKPFYKGMSAL